MPELAEIKLTADYINKVSNSYLYIGVEKNSKHKCIDITIPSHSFTITAQSRGKELSLQCGNVSIKLTLGLTGYFTLVLTGKEPKHTQLFFYRSDGYTLCFVDVRRFGKWIHSDNWNIKRGPDPILQYQQFKNNIISNLHKAVFNKPIYVILMDQQYFNGIGNYLRAEILYRLSNVNPFASAKLAIKQEPLLLQYCCYIPKLVYMGGGSQNFYMLAYGNPKMLRIKDRNGRTFWYDPIWKGCEVI